MQIGDPLSVVKPVRLSAFDFTQIKKLLPSHFAVGKLKYSTGIPTPSLKKTWKGYLVRVGWMFTEEEHSMGKKPLCLLVALQLKGVIHAGENICMDR